MLSSDQTIVSNRSSVTLPGSAASTVFAQITGPGGQRILRRVAATANTTPTTLTIGHEFTGKVGYAQKLSSMVKCDYRVLNVDPDLTGGIVPVCEVYTVIRRPVLSGGAITDSILSMCVGSVCDILTVSGNLAKLLNQEA